MSNITALFYTRRRRRRDRREAFTSQAVHLLQALRVVLARSLARVRRAADGRASPALSTALSVVLRHVRRCRGRGSARLARRRSRLRGRGRATALGRRRRATRSGRHAALSASESRSDLAPLDVREDHVRVRVLGLHVSRLASVRAARATLSSGLASCVDRVRRVEPERVGGVVVPEREREDHAALEGAAHAGHATDGLEVVVVVEHTLLDAAERVRELRNRCVSAGIAQESSPIV
jgi:hypothetical protein